MENLSMNQDISVIQYELEEIMKNVVQITTK